MHWAFIECSRVVRHRIDGLEITECVSLFVPTVRHRIDGLETEAAETLLAVEVRHRIDGLERIGYLH